MPSAAEYEDTALCQGVVILRIKVKNTRFIAVTGVLSALSFILMLLEFSVPLMPEFIKFDFSDLPAIIGSFSMGPAYGAIICFVKNLLHLTVSSTAGIGELSNFLIGCVYAVTAGIIYKYKKTRTGAVTASFAASAAAAVFCILSNRLLVYPLYGTVLGLSNDVILSMYRTVMPSISDLTTAILIFNAPFTLVKGLADSVITLLIYKKISPLLKGKSSK